MVCLRLHGRVVAPPRGGHSRPIGGRPGPIAPQPFWSFARAHLDQLLSRLDSLSRCNFVPSIFAAFSDVGRAEELERFVGPHAPDDLRIKSREVADQIRFKAAFKRRELPRVSQWLAGRNAERIAPQARP